MFPDLRKVKLRELVEAGLAHVGNVQVTNLAACFLRHVIDVLLHPIDVIKWRFVVSRHNRNVTRAVVGRFGIHAQDHLSAGSADERVVKVWQTRDWRVVDCQNVIAGFHIHADICKR